jgi:hypothetical protein
MNAQQVPLCLVKCKSGHIHTQLPTAPISSLAGMGEVRVDMTQTGDHINLHRAEMRELGAKVMWWGCAALVIFIAGVLVGASLNKPASAEQVQQQVWRQ